jgi:hypothetical protein
MKSYSYGESTDLPQNLFLDSSQIHTWTRFTSELEALRHVL